jgi:hypothetical protein
MEQTLIRHRTVVIVPMFARQEYRDPQSGQTQQAASVEGYQGKTQAIDILSLR